MNTAKRYLRKPISTLLWLLIILLAEMLIGVAASLYFSASAVPRMLDESMTTIAIQMAEPEKIADGVYSFNPNDALLFDEDVDYLRSLPQVKDVDFRTFSGAYIENLNARIAVKFDNEIDAYFDIGDCIGSRVTESYRNVILFGTVEQTWTSQGGIYQEPNPSGPLIGEPIEYEYVNAVLHVDEIQCLHPDYPVFADETYPEYDGRVTVQIPFSDKDSGTFFEIGKRYVVQGGYYSPGRLHASGDPLGVPSLPHVYTVSTVPCTTENGVLVQDANGRIPIATEWNASSDALFETPYWGFLKEELDMYLHAFPVLATNDLESMYSFLTNDATIVKGRSFTPEEIKRGAKVLILDETVADDAGLCVGDTVSVRQFLPAIGSTEYNYSVDTELFDAGYRANNPALGAKVFYRDKPHEAEAFEIVGLYRMENEWKNSMCSFSPNTIFMPKGAQIDGAFGGPSKVVGVDRYETTVTVTDDNGETQEEPRVYEDPITDYGCVTGVYLSIILKNGSSESFLERIAADSEYREFEDAQIPGKINRHYTSGLCGHQFLIFDQGYEAAKESIDAVTASAAKLVLLIAASAVLLFAMYLLLYQSSERRTIGIMRSLGAKQSRARRYLFLSGLILAAIGIVVGTVLSYFAASFVSDRLISLSVSQAGSGFDASYTDLFTDMMHDGAVPLSSLLLLMLAEIGLSATVLFVQAHSIAKTNPRKLLGK